MSSCWLSTSSSVHLTTQPIMYYTVIEAKVQCGSSGKESSCNVGDLGLIPPLGRSPREGNSYLTPVLENYMDYSPWGHKESDKTEWLSLSLSNVSCKESVWCDPTELQGSFCYLSYYSSHRYLNHYMPKVCSYNVCMSKQYSKTTFLVSVKKCLLNICSLTVLAAW